MAYDVYVFDEKINSTTTSANSIKWSGRTTLKDYMDINDSFIQQQFLTQSRQIEGVTNAVATPFVSGTTYNPGEYVMYSLKTWKCLVANNETPSEGANWTKVIIADEISNLNDTLSETQETVSTHTTQIETLEGALKYNVGDTITFPSVMIGAMNATKTELTVDIVLDKPIDTSVSSIAFSSFSANWVRGEGKSITSGISKGSIKIQNKANGIVELSVTLTWTGNATTVCAFNGTVKATLS